jgi:WD40 repeat protein
LKELIAEPVGQDTVEALAFSPDGRQVAVGAADGVVAVYSLHASAAEEAVRIAKMHAGFTSSIAWSPAGDRVLSAAGDGSVRIWDPRSLQPLQSFTAYPATHPAAVWAPNGQKIALAQGRDTIQVINLAGNADPQTLSLPGTTRALLWLPNGQIAGSDLTGNVAFFQPGKRDPVRTYTPSAAHKAVNSLSLLPDGSLLAAGYDDGAIVLIDPATAKEVRQLPKGQSVGNVAWSPNGKVLAESSIEFALTFFNPLGKQLAKLNIGYDMNGVGWSPDGQYVAAGSDDHTLKIWQVSPAQGMAGATAPTPPSYMGR